MDLAKKIKMFFAVAAMLSFAGCAMFDHPLPEVNDSQLNWLQVNYRPVGKTRKPFHINLIQTGYVNIKEGTSPLVFDEFSSDVDNPLWGDIKEEKLGLPPDLVRSWLQRFVDVGLTAESSKARTRNRRDGFGAQYGIANFAANINQKKYVFVTDNPVLIDPVVEFIEIVKSNKGYK